MFKGVKPSCRYGNWLCHIFWHTFGWCQPLFTCLSLLSRPPMPDCVLLHPCGPLSYYYQIVCSLTRVFVSTAHGFVIARAPPETVCGSVFICWTKTNIVSEYISSALGLTAIQAGSPLCTPTRISNILLEVFSSVLNVYFSVLYDF